MKHFQVSILITDQLLILITESTNRYLKKPLFGLFTVIDIDNILRD